MSDLNTFVSGSIPQSDLMAPAILIWILNATKSVCEHLLESFETMIPLVAADGSSCHAPLSAAMVDIEGEEGTSGSSCTWVPTTTTVTLGLF